MNNQQFLIIFIFLLFLLYFLKNRSLEYFDSDDYDDLLFTDYTKKFMSSKYLDHLPKHMRLNKTGGLMYISNSIPSEGGCYPVKCPPLVKDDLTPGCYNNQNLTCWKCNTHYVQNKHNFAKYKYNL